MPDPDAAGQSPRQLYLCAEGGPVRDALCRILSDIEGYELIVVPELAGIDAPPRHARAIVIASCIALSALRRGGPVGFHALVRAAHVILALDSAELVRAAPLITMADSLLFVDVQLDRAREIVRMAESGYFLTPKRINVIPHPRVDPELLRLLSSQELAVLVRVGQGLGNRNIAEHLGMTEAWVKFVVHGLLAKLGMRNRTQLAVLVARNQMRVD
jgi:DNA-binding NarL/FixJ family response regulator